VGWVRKLRGYKVLVDSNILVSSSIYYTSKDLGIPIKHRFYDMCKTLINYFRKNIDKKIGFYTKRIDMTSNRVLSDAVLSTVREISKKDSRVKEKKLLAAFSVIYSESLRRLEENKDYLLKETVNEIKTNKLRRRISYFYKKIKKEIQKRNPQFELERAKKIKATSPIMKTIRFARIQEAKRKFPHYGILVRKFIESGPGREDIQLLSEAIYFKEVFVKNKIKFYLASTDHHFVEIEKNGIVNDFVPHLIKEEFNIECLKPDKILKVIK
jgi:hypothetical protein